MSKEPAFPSHGSMGEVTQEGMTLRDYFAAKAMAALVSIDPVDAKQLTNPQGRSYDEWISSDAYKIADAMLKERES